MAEAIKDALWRWDTDIDDGECSVPYQLPHPLGDLEVVAHRWVMDGVTKKDRRYRCVGCGLVVRKPWRRAHG